MTGPRILDRRSILLAGTATSRHGAIREVGSLLVDSGSVQPGYPDSMIERDDDVSTYMGNFLAVPHGTGAAKESVSRSALALVRYAEPVDWKGHQVRLVLGIAGSGTDHLTLLSKVAGVFCDEAVVHALLAAGTVGEVQALLASLEAPDAEPDLEIGSADYRHELPNGNLIP